jgi:hypothetical protein
MPFYSDNRVFVSKELIQRSDESLFSPNEVEGHIIEALIRPTGKLAARSYWMPDSRFIQDYWLHKSMKAFTGVSILGFSVNPEHCEGDVPKSLFYHKLFHRPEGVSAIITALLCCGRFI